MYNEVYSNSYLLQALPATNLRFQIKDVFAGWTNSDDSSPSLVCNSCFRSLHATDSLLYFYFRCDSLYPFAPSLWQLVSVNWERVLLGFEAVLLHKTNFHFTIYSIQIWYALLLASSQKHSPRYLSKWWANEGHMSSSEKYRTKLCR